MQIVDLSQTFEKGLRGFDIQQKKRLEDCYNTTDLSIYSHAGTHMDAPLHFVDGGGTIAQLPLQKCVGEALVVDLSFKEPHSLITTADLGPAAEKISRGSRVLLRTGWAAHAGMDDFRTSFPRVSLELAAWFATKGIWLLGVESPSVASLQDLEEVTLVHRALLDSDIIIVESLINLHLLPENVYFIALPLKIAGGDGSPVRAAAVI